MTRLEQMLRLHEGEKLMPYKCTAGKLTIGVGRNLEARGISRDESDLMLRNDIDICITDLLQFDWFDNMNQARQDAITDMRFNLGAGGFRQFKQTIGHLSAKRYEEAAAGMLNSAWAKQVGKRAKRLAEMVRIGEYVD